MTRTAHRTHPSTRVVRAAGRLLRSAHELTRMEGMTDADRAALGPVIVGLSSVVHRHRGLLGFVPRTGRPVWNEPPMQRRR